MKLKSILCLTGFFFMFVMNVQSSGIGNSGIGNYVFLSGNDIPWDTEFGDGNDHRSLRPTMPFFVALFENNLMTIDFVAAIGEVEVTISQNGTSVYTSSENIVVPVLKNIQLPSDLTGTFLIEIQGDNGAYACGWFNL